MKLSIGEIIAADIKKSGLSVTYIAQQIGMSRKGLSDVLKRNDMSLSQLASLSDIIGKDYFAIYRDKYEEENGTSLPVKATDEVEPYQQLEKPQDISFTLTIVGAVAQLKEEIPSFLDLIHREAESRGLHLG